MSLSIYRICRETYFASIMIFSVFISNNGQGQTANSSGAVTIGSKKMAYKTFNLKSRKPGDPILVFESGLGGNKENFDALIPLLSPTIPGITYDRNGLGDSQIDTTVRTDFEVEKRLHDLLTDLKIPPPYILVGHSLGGAFIRLFTARYPAEVSGLVFIDATDFMLTEEEDELVRKNSGSAMGYRKLFVGMMDEFQKDSSLPLGIRYEMKRVGDANRGTNYFKDYSTLSPLPDIPVTIFMEYNRPIEYQETQLMNQYKINGQAWFKELNRFRILHFSEMVENNHHSVVILLPGYSHGIHQQDPLLVANGVKDLYRKVVEWKK